LWLLEVLRLLVSLCCLLPVSWRGVVVGDSSLLLLWLLLLLL
jgi:hypothetical protein